MQDEIAESLLMCYNCFHSLCHTLAVLSAVETAPSPSGYVLPDCVIEHILLMCELHPK